MSGIIGTSHSKSKVVGRSKDTAKAWINLNGTSTPAANQSFNVSTIGDLAVGNWTINFARPMDSTTYCVTSSTQAGYIAEAETFATGSFVLKNGDSSWSAVDLDYVCAAVYEN